LRDLRGPNENKENDIHTIYYNYCDDESKFFNLTECSQLKKNIEFQMH